jgi:hypothetical protein
VQVRELHVLASSCESLRVFLAVGVYERCMCVIVRVWCGVVYVLCDGRCKARDFRMYCLWYNVCARWWQARMCVMIDFVCQSVRVDMAHVAVGCDG